MASFASGLPTGRRGQMVAAALVVLAVAALVFGIIAPLAGWYGERAETLGELQARAAREAALVQALPALREQAANASANHPTQAILAGDSDAVAGAQLQEQVQAMAAQASAQLTSVETLPAEQVGAYRRIGVRLALSAQLPIAVRLMAQLEQAAPTLILDDIRLTATPVGPMGVTLPLDCALTVYAFRAGTKADSAASAGDGSESAP